MSAIDLRSDTVTRPSAAMRRAMAEAEVGDAAGGKVMPPAVTAGIVTAARTAGMSVHLDGARLWNAATALCAARHAHRRRHHGDGQPVEGAGLSGRLLPRLPAGVVAARLGDPQTLRPSDPETNIVTLDLVRERDVADAVIPRLAAEGVLVVSFGPRRLRAETHLDVHRADIERAADIIVRVLA